MNSSYKEIEAKINAALDSVRPFLQADGGDVELVGFDEDLVVRLKLLGACAGCNISHMTMKAGIEESIRKVLPDLKEVVAVN